MDADKILKSDVFDRDGRHLGRVDAVWRDPATDRAEFVAVHRGLTADLLVPLAAARWDAVRRAIVVPYGEETIRRAPSVAVSGDMQDEEELRLREHYGLPMPKREAPSGRFGSAMGRRADEEDHIRLRQVLRLEREPQVRGEVERETVVEDDVVIPLDERDRR